ncbi:hypothetical protein LSTR_LSTR006848 [Laodelphax striatellus]|uniref:Protein MIS12 homolog n=1 Tax=Laodelphax striatellus TaxID=195883 RepID=A0A482XG80_LAOST|nr:hypothetical protein LSTR_LSTR006848 [Laodelphax striatellus]
MDEQIRRKLTREEYELQFFGFTHTMFNNYVRNLTIQEIKNSVTTLKDNLKRKYSEEIPEEELNFLGDRLLDLYMNSSKVPSSNIEKVIEECISVPDHVLLVEDEAYQRNQFPGVEVDELDKQIQELKCQAVKAKYMEMRLMEELAIIDLTVDLGKKKVNELKKKALVIKQKDKRNKELVDKLEATISSDLV